MRRALIIGLPVFLALAGCASSTPEETDHASFTPRNDAVSDVLTPVDVAAKPGAAESTPNPLYTKLMDALSSRGIEGVGLEYEENVGLTLLTEVFTDPKTAPYDISLLYTGLEMSYDKRHKSLTVGGLTQKNAVIAYIQKKVPKRSGGATSVPVAKPPPEIAPDPMPKSKKAKKSPKGKAIKGRKKVSPLAPPKRKPTPRTAPKAPVKRPPPSSETQPIIPQVTEPESIQQPAAEPPPDVPPPITEESPPTQEPEPPAETPAEPESEPSSDAPAEDSNL